MGVVLLVCFSQTICFGPREAEWDTRPCLVVPEKEGKPLQPSQGESLVGGVPCSKCALAVTLNSCSSRLPGTQSLVHSMGEGGEQVPERASDCVFPSGCSFPARNNYGVM